MLQFCDISLRALDSGICTYKGQWEHIQSNTRWLPQTYALFVILSLSTILFLIYLEILTFSSAIIVETLVLLLLIL